MIIENLHFNKIIVIESLSEKERKTGKELYNDILCRREFQMRTEFEAVYHVVDSFQSLVEIFDRIKSEVNKSLIAPILHFEMHGSPDGIHLTSGKFVSWHDLHTFFREINTITDDSLLVTFATCYGLSVLSNLTSGGKSPFWSVIGSNDEVF